MVGVRDFLLHALKYLQVDPIGALIMEAHQIVEHRHLISGQISQGHRSFAVESILQTAPLSGGR